VPHKGHPAEAAEQTLHSFDDHGVLCHSVAGGAQGFEGEPHTTGSLRAWFKAARPLAQANIAGPLLLGQGFAFAKLGAFSWSVLGLVAAFGVADHLFIVFANDYADREHDTDQRTLFSGGSGVLQNGDISARSLRRAAILMGVMLLVLGSLFVTRSPWPLVLAIAALVLLWAYSYPPLRLSYRGGGEWLQGLGVGGVLPLFGYAAQAGELASFPWSIGAGCVLLAASANIATSLPDIAADRRAKKRTIAVKKGIVRAAWSCIGLSVIALYWLSWTGHVHFGDGWLAFAVVPLMPLLVQPPRTPGASIRFIVLHGLTTQTVFLGWTAWLFWGS
jgi:1,4-dihydroxy-2-naphthoate octaprenyltransferase